MSEDIAVKAPVTRLRRRLSIESEEVKSPAGTTTPTKKKGGRLATKPQLDLIEEIDAEQAPKRSTRKTAIKDVEPVEEKPMTPSRRSARIRSNTSILSEPPLALDSPRAKRAAARRTSLAGSDNEAPVTPARVTRRTRKDSTSSIDKPVEKATTKTSAATEVIVEEQETTTNETDSKDKSINKSPNPRGKGGKKKNLSKSSNDTEEDIDIKNDKDLKNSTDKENQVISDGSIKSMRKATTDDSTKTNSEKNSDNNVEANEIITENLDAKPKSNSSILHKSTSAIEDSKSFKSKRHRTISVSVLPSTNANECSFFSDTEISKKNRKNKSLTTHSSDYNINKKDDTQNTGSKKSMEMENDIEIKLNNTTKNRTVNEESITGTEESMNNSVVKTGWKKNIINQIQTGSKLDSKDKGEYVSPIKCFENAPSKNIQSVVILDDDSDSNVGMNDNNILPVPYLDSEDQCVPVVQHDNQNDNNVEIPHDNSYEPMDIDESIQQNTSNNKSVKNTPKSPNELGTKNQSLVSMDQSDDCNNLNPDKSKRKSLLSSFESHNEKSTCESKSTLILSQIKDMSSSENDKKTPKVTNKDKLSKSINVPDNIKKKQMGEKKLSLDYSTSTPLQQKSNKKLGVPIDTSLISPKNSNTDIMSEEKRESKKDSSFDDDNDMDQSDESGEEITKTQNEIIDDEAVEAGEDYESGDSQDEDERQYEEQNRIVEKGETLESEEEFSDDTDYEKDSFVVSSDEEDNELLSGSGDDLSMSDNELSMSTKSKKKYNEKKIKEQKKASREMYASRHKQDISKNSAHKPKSKKNNRQRLDSSSTDSDDEVTVKTKKNNRQRIDSSQDLSEDNSDAHKSLTKKDKTNPKKKQKHLSESICEENELNEQEISIFSENKMEEKDPISISVKHEPKTPQKDNNLSAIVINENIEEVDVDQNKSISKPNETSDPLQATMLDVDESSSSGEENKEIMKNYNSVLENLNSKPKGNKMHNNSLNIDKKQKKTKEAIIDQLNLTQSKSKKIKKKSVAKEGSEDEAHKEKEHSTSIDKDDDDGSDSINMRLLFTEESNDSETPNTDNVKEVSTANINVDIEHIPLKESEARINLLEDMDDTKNSELNIFIDTTGTRDGQDEQNNVSLSASSKKKKKRNSECNVMDVKESSIISAGEFGIKTPKKTLDTEVFNAGVVANDSDKITPQSEKKIKKGKKSLNAMGVQEKETETQIEIVQDEPTVETRTPQSEKTKNKSISSLEESENMCNILMENEQDICFDMKSSSEKKKKKAKQSLTYIQNESVDETSEVPSEEYEKEASFNILTSDKKKKKSKQSLSDSHVEQIDETSEVPTDENKQEVSFNVFSTNNKKKKNAKQSLTGIQVEQVNETTEVPANDNEQEASFKVLTTSEKKKKKSNQSLTGIQVEQVDETIEVPANDNEQEASFNVLTTSEKKKKKSKQSLTGIQVEQVDETIEVPANDNEQEASFNVLTTSEKKKKKSKQSLTGIQVEQVDETIEVPANDNEQEASFNVLTTSEKKKKKSKQSLTGIQVEQVDETIEAPANDNEQEASFNVLTTSEKKKKKAKQSLTGIQVEQVDETIEVPANDNEQEASFNVLTTSEKKKKKSKQSLTGIQVEQVDETIEAPANDNEQEASFNVLTTSEKKKKKAKQSLTGIQVEQVDETIEVPANDNEQEASFNVLTTSEKKKKKSKQSLTGIQVEQVDEITEVPANDNEQEESFNVLTTSEKKKKKSKQSLTGFQVEQVDETSGVPAYGNEQEASFNDFTTSDKQNKKSKKSLSNIQNEQVGETGEVPTEPNSLETSFDILTSSDKKKKKTKTLLNNIENEQVVETNEIATEVAQQKRKKRISSQSNDNVNEIPLEHNKSGDEAPLEIIYQSNKNKSGLQPQLSETTIDNNVEIGSKKRKRKHSALTDEGTDLEDVKENPKNNLFNISSTGRQNKKRKINNNSSDLSAHNKDAMKDDKEVSNVGNSKPTKLKKNKHTSKQENIQIIERAIEKTRYNKKRKERDDDDITNMSKLPKQSSFNESPVTRLPSHILNQLGDKPNKAILEAKKGKVVSTTKFTVEDARVRRNKPSNYLEESVYLNDDTVLEKKQKYSIKKPKVLPFIPTASTSDKGFTTNFRINVLPTETQFVAQATDITNFKKDFLQQQKMKKFHTFEKYKNQRNVKLSKF